MGNSVYRALQYGEGPWGAIAAYGLLDSIISGNLVFDVTAGNRGIWLSDGARIAVCNNTVSRATSSGGEAIVETGTANYNTFVGNVLSGHTTLLTTVGANSKAAHNIGVATHTA